MQDDLGMIGSTTKFSNVSQYLCFNTIFSKNMLCIHNPLVSYVSLE